MAEEFRDASGKETLIFVDNIFRFTQAGSRSRRCWVVCPRPWATSRRSRTEMGELQERITSTSKGAITSVQAIYVPADDLTDPGPRRRSATWTRSWCSSVATSPRRASIPPSIRWPRPRGSWIRRSWASALRVARQGAAILQRYRDLQDIIAILGVDELAEEDKLIVARAPQASSGS